MQIIPQKCHKNERNFNFIAIFLKVCHINNMTKTKHMPTMAELTDFLNAQTRALNKRDIARQFGIKGDQRTTLKKMLRSLKDAGVVQSSQKGRRVFATDALPEQVIVEITGLDSMGDLIARPFKWTSDTPTPQIIVTKDKLNPPAGVGDIVQTRVKPIGNKLYEAEALRRVSAGENHMVAVYRDGLVYSVDRRIKEAFELQNTPKTIQNGDLLVVDIPPIRSPHPTAEFVKKIGNETESFAPTLISIYQHNIPVAFSEGSEKQAQKATVPPLGKRTDLRAIPFVTIDGADARDFDDAVWAEPDNNPKNKGGFHIMVGIADVAHYVPAGSYLDLDARLRGNSVYFPDRVIPMLPFELSNGVCSLNPNQPRAAMVCEAWIDKTGHKIKHRFVRALIQSTRRLTYEEVQAAIDRHQDIIGLETEIQSLTDVYRLLHQKRQKRGVLELDVPERQVILNDKGQITEIKLRVQTDSHKLIEELMILANVAAAETLEDKSVPTLYRVHDRPSVQKLETLNAFLTSLGIHQTLTESAEPKDFNDILVQANKTANHFAVNEFVLRSQSQAVYSPENIGHFGLSLDRYAHFTSPIRRYADIMVHRALITALKLGKDGLSDDETNTFEEIARHISDTERQAASAEQDAVDRYTARYLADKIGSQFTARISSVTAFGLFVTLDKIGADGFVPMSNLRSDYFEYDAPASRLIGRNTGILYQVGQNVSVVLKECVPVTGGMIFDILRGKGSFSSTQKPIKLPRAQRKQKIKTQNRRRKRK